MDGISAACRGSTGHLVDAVQPGDHNVCTDVRLSLTIHFLTLSPINCVLINPLWSLSAFLTGIHHEYLYYILCCQQDPSEKCLTGRIHEEKNRFLPHPIFRHRKQWHGV